MKKIILAVILLSLMASPCFPGQPIFEQVIPVTSGVTYIMTVPDDVIGGYVQVSSGGAVRMTFGKLTVTSVVGTYINAHDAFTFRSRGEMVAAQFTVDTGNSGATAFLHAVGFDYRDW